MQCFCHSVVNNVAVDTLSKILFLIATVFLISGVAAATGDLTIIAKNEDSVRISDTNVTVSSSSETATETTDSQGEAFFEDLPADTYSVKLEHSDYNERTIQVTIESNTDTTKTVILERTIEKGTLKVSVVNENENAIGNAEVRIFSQDSDHEARKTTGSQGRVTFRDIPAEQYDVLVDHDDYSSGRITAKVDPERTSDVSVTMQESDTTTNERNLEIRQVIMPSLLKKGATFESSVKVVNTGDQQENNIRVTTESFGQKKVSETFSLASGESRWIVLKATVPRDASGPEEIQAEVKNNNDRDVVVVSTTVSDMRAYMQISPNPSTVGEAAYVKGRVVHESTGEGASHASANLYLGNRFITGVTTDATGRYDTFVRPDLAQTYTVSLQNSNFRVSKTLHVTPDVEVSDIEAPETARANQAPQVCAAVSAGGKKLITTRLKIDAETVQTRNVQIDGQKRVCFTIPTAPTGKKHVFIEAESDGVKDGMGTFVTIKPPTSDLGMSVSGDLQTTVGKAVNITATVDNPSNYTADATVALEGFEGWVQETEQSVSVPAGGERTLHFTVTPDTSGEHTGIVSLQQSDGTSMRRDVTLQVGAKKVSRSGGVIDSIGSAVGSVGNTLENGGRSILRTAGTYKYLIIALVILVIGVLVRNDLKDAMTPASLEPQNQ
jgi:hypothetical protein